MKHTPANFLKGYLHDNIAAIRECILPHAPADTRDLIADLNLHTKRYSDSIAIPTEQVVSFSAKQWFLLIRAWATNDAVRDRLFYLLNHLMRVSS